MYIFIAGGLIVTCYFF